MAVEQAVVSGTVSSVNEVGFECSKSRPGIRRQNLAASADNLSVCVSPQRKTTVFFIAVRLSLARRRFLHPEES